MGDAEIGGAVFPGEQIEGHEAHVVPRALVLGTGIAETDDEFHCRFLPQACKKFSGVATQRGESITGEKNSSPRLRRIHSSTRIPVRTSSCVLNP